VVLEFRNFSESGEGEIAKRTPGDSYLRQIREEAVRIVRKLGDFGSPE
jgi:hypothetical protein